MQLNPYEKAQYVDLLMQIRADAPNRPRHARDYIPLIRARVCRAVNEDIDAGSISDIKVIRSTGQVDLYYHI